MKNKPLIVLAGSIAVALILGVLIGRLTSSQEMGADSEQTLTESEEPSQWTCSMHPNILQPEPGDCPICGMDLIPLKKDVGVDLGPRAMSMTESAVALADIQTTEVKREFPVAEVTLVGRLE